MPKSSRLVFTFCVLLAMNTMNLFDRQVLPAVQEKIRKDWKLSDTELGWLGTAFILLYAVVGLPLGRLADRWNRRRLLAAGVALWSVTTFAAGFAWGFWSLFVLRLCVGIGEATCAPTASSLIGDLVPAKRRARAMAVFMLGLPLGLALSFFVSVAQAGTVSGLVYGCGALGLFAAGWLGDRAFRRGPSGRLHVAWVGLAAAIPCLLFALAAPPGRLWLCVAGLLPGCLLLYAYY